MSVSTSLQGQYLHIIVDNPPVNALSQQVRAGIVTAVHELNDLAQAQGALLICKGKTFIAGADIREMGKPDLEPLLPDVIATLRQSAKPIVACLHGSVLGGGLEIAMVCPYRIALGRTRLGFPEVHLGLIPGSGGTQFLPRLVGAQAALDIIVSGKPIKADQAKKIGLLDQICYEDLQTHAAALLDKQQGKKHPMLTDSPAASTLDEDAWLEIEKATAKKARGQLSPVRATQLVKRATETSLPDGMAEERASFLELRASAQSVALRHLFFAERAVARPATLKPELARNVASVGVIGAGTMGSGIATSVLNAGLQVLLIERDDSALQRGLDTINSNLDAAIKRGLLTEDGKHETLQRLTTSTALQDLNAADLIIEAVFEEMAIKQDLFRELDNIAKDNAILASNTSYLNVNQIAAVTKRPESVIGLHFFSPAHVMKLLEVVKADKSSDIAMATGFAVAAKLRKTAVQVGVCDGFVGNRILREYRFQAETLLEEGCLPQQIDAAMTELGFAMGPFAMQDMAGLDISWANRKMAAPQRDPNSHYVEIADTLCENGRFGQKTGAGWYRYETGSRRPLPDPVVEEWIVKASEQRGIQRREFSNEAIQLRVIAAIANEGARILEENIADRPLDIDVIYVNGYGFPRHLGGPMHYADTLGLEKLAKITAKVAQQYPHNITIAQLTAELISKNTGFASLN